MTQSWGDPDPGRSWRAGVAAPGDPAPGEAPDSPAPPPAPPPPPPPPPPPTPGGEWSYFPPPWQVPPLYEPPPTVPFLVRAKAPALTFGVTTAVLTLLGAPLALLWRAVAPVTQVARTASGPQLAAPESSQVFATDGWFVLVSLVAGLVLGAALWAALRHRGPAAPFALAAGGVAAASVAAAVGRRLVVDSYVYEICHRPDYQCHIYDGTLRLHALPAIVTFPVALLVSFAVLTFAFDRARDS